jgi:WD40 repeat protein
MTTGTERAAVRNPSDNVVTAAISPDGTGFAVADYKGLVTFWDLATLKSRPTQLRHEGLCSLAFAPDGRVVATGGFDGTINLWHLTGPSEG